MGKGAKGRQGKRLAVTKSAPKPKPGRQQEPELSGSESELDDFQQQKNKISFQDDLGDDEAADGLLDEGVYDLSEDDEDDDFEEEMELGGRIAQMAKQAKLLRRQQRLEEREDEDEGEEGEEEEEAVATWGASKRAYYDADTAEAMGDEEAANEEEQEVLRLQAARAGRLQAADFGLDDEEEEEEGAGSEDEGDAAEDADMLERVVHQAGPSGRPRAASSAGGAAVEIETVAKNLDALSSEERLAVIMADAPELVALLAELRQSLDEVRHRVGPLLREVREGGLATAEGVSYLEAKHLLLLSYCSHIVFYLMLKAEGRPLRDHPVIGRLVQLRSYLEKIRPIDKQLKYQMEKLIKAAQLAHTQEEDEQADGAAAGAAAAVADDDDDMLRYRPNPDKLVPKIDAATTATAGGAAGRGEAAAPVGVYKPPKLNPVSMSEDPDKPLLNAQERRRLKEAQRKAARSNMVRELAQELAGAPEELRSAAPGFDTAAALRQRHKLDARAGVEEELLQRVPLSKDEARRLKAQRREGMSGRGLLDDFADEVTDLVDLATGDNGRNARGGSSLSGLFEKQRLSQKFGADLLSQQAAARRPGGDDDVPTKAPLHERRAKYDSVAARRAAAAAAGGSSDDDGPPGGKRDREEDEFYVAARETATAKKRARQEAHAPSPLAPPLEEPRSDRARGVTTEIQKNRGLTPHRNKDLKNPRKKNRIKFDQAKVRRKGQVQDVRQGSSKYGGEATGIKAKVSKSRRLG